VAAGVAGGGALVGRVAVRAKRIARPAALQRIGRLIEHGDVVFVAIEVFEDGASPVRQVHEVRAPVRQDGVAG